MGDILKDSRFTKFLNDPRYRQIPKQERKVKIDKRFQSMFNDEKFKVKYTVDKRGRPVNETSTENLRKYYDLETDSSGSDDDDDIDQHSGSGISKESSETEIESEEPGQFVKRPEREELPAISSNDKLIRGKLDKKIKEKLLDLDIDYARGEGVLMTDSSSDESSSEEEDADDVKLEHEWGELDADAGTTEESTKRIAICNMDWDNIKATDLMVLLNSFLPPGSIIHSISIYPSEYGLKRMQEEEVKGPLELTKETKDDDSSEDGGNEEGSSYHMEKLRRYQLNRLKYYYAVVVCDTVKTADILYNECDGMEYESSATRLDMRFIPDDVTFDQESREVCDSLPDMSKYKPRLFTTTALQQAKVELTWDATNPNRAEALREALSGKIDNLDLKEYLASSSEDEDSAEDHNSESENEDQDPIQKYKSLLQDIEKKEDTKRNKDMEMEITWGLGVKSKTEELIKKKMNEDKDLTPFEKLLKKRKEKNKLKKLKKSKTEQETNSTKEKDDYSSDDVPSDVDMNDPYFAEEFNKPEFKKSSKTKTQAVQSDLSDEDSKKKAELELLLDDDNDGKAHFSLKKIQESENSTKKSKRKKKLYKKLQEQKQSVPEFEINLEDQRFSALYNSHLYNIDPTNPNFKKTKNMDKLIQEKLKRRPADIPVQNKPYPKKPKQDAELSLLVKNIKRKTKDVLNK